ncbi:MAG: tetratricopeptide repeat protein, partial [Alphaproteobacteria bacterium]|nr:tetratricopeptide repeat protein [Alphaproteobacteria bacterium]
MSETEAARTLAGQGIAGEGLASPSPDAAAPHPDAGLQQALEAANAKNSALAEQLTRDFLAAHPSDVNAMKLLGELLMQKNNFASAQEAEALFVKCLELSPGFTAARHSYAKLLLKMAKLAAAKAQLEMLLQSAPENPSFKQLMAYTLGQIGDYAPALEYHGAVLPHVPPAPPDWMVYANDLR